jgi:hypothetical protein
MRRLCSIAQQFSILAIASKNAQSSGYCFVYIYCEMALLWMDERRLGELQESEQAQDQGIRLSQLIHPAFLST